MKKDSKQRLFEVMGRLDKTFKPVLKEGFEEIEGDTTPDTGQAPDFQIKSDSIEIPANIPNEDSVEDQTPEEKLVELTAKVDELYNLLHGNSEDSETPEVTPEELPSNNDNTDGIEIENLQEWNFDKKKGDKDSDKDSDDKDSDDKDSDDKKEKELDENDSKKIPVVAIPKVGK